MRERKLLEVKRNGELPQMIGMRQIVLFLVPGAILDQQPRKRDNETKGDSLASLYIVNSLYIAYI